MATFNPALPANNSPITAAELRTQLTALYEQITMLPSGDDVADQIRTIGAPNVDSVGTLTQTVSNPPTQAQVQAIQDKLNALITALHWS
jgi:hypothetical protein